MLHAPTYYTHTLSVTLSLSITLILYSVCSVMYYTVCYTTSQPVKQCNAIEKPRT